MGVGDLAHKLLAEALRVDGGEPGVVDAQADQRQHLRVSLPGRPLLGAGDHLLHFGLQQLCDALHWTKSTHKWLKITLKQIILARLEEQYLRAKLRVPRDRQQVRISTSGSSGLRPFCFASTICAVQALWCPPKHDCERPGAAPNAIACMQKNYCTVCMH